MFYSAVHDPDKCQQCGACGEIVLCPGADELICLGCGACVLACPYEALQLEEDPRVADVTIEVDGKVVQVPERISVKDALVHLGYPIAHLSEEPGIFVPCEVGGCWSCNLEIDGEMKPSCRVGVKEGMRVNTELPKDYTPRRIIVGFSGHPTGGVGTPWQDKVQDGYPVEVVCFSAGCNFRCPQCQNWNIAYKGTGNPMTPREAAVRLSLERETQHVNRMTISGGESTLNRPWLVQFIKELKTLNPDPDARFHVDTNGSLLTRGYIDELVEAGMTDVGIDLKSSDIDNFMRITGLKDRNLAERYKEIAWEAVEYTVQKYSDRVHVGVGIPYNRDLNPVAEIKRMGERLSRISPSIPVTVLNYRPEFRSKISGPGDNEMQGVYQVLKGVGLKIVLCQTTHGHIGP